MKRKMVLNVPCSLHIMQSEFIHMQDMHVHSLKKYTTVLKIQIILIHEKYACRDFSSFSGVLLQTIHLILTKGKYFQK